MSNIKKICEEIISAGENSVDRPWSYDEHENEVHSDVSQEYGGDPAHICQPIGYKGRHSDNANYIVLSANHADKLARVIKMILESEISDNLKQKIESSFE